MTDSADIVTAESGLPRIAMISLHGYVAADPPLGAADTGGQVVYVLELSKRLAQLGHEVDIYTRRFEDQPEFDEVADNVRVIRIPCGGPDFITKEHLVEHVDEWCAGALDFIRAHALRYTFINSHYWDAGVAGQKLSDWLDIPHVHTPHSLGLWKLRQMETDYPGDHSRLEKIYNFDARVAAERDVYRRCNLLVATTPEQYELVVQDYGVAESHVCMVPPGYDDNRYYPVGEASRDSIRHRLGFEGHVVLALGRLARNKGYDLLIDAFDLVAERDPAATLLLAIGGEDANESETRLLRELEEQAARSPAAKRIQFRSFVADDDLADYYRAADLFVLCSRYEPFGMTAIEAMASGTPTVVTIHGGLYQALSYGRHALYADPLDAADLGMTMAKVFKHPKLAARISLMGAHKARSLFTWSGVAQQLIAAVDGKPAGPNAFHDTDWDEPWHDDD